MVQRTKDIRSRLQISISLFILLPELETHFYLLILRVTSLTLRIIRSELLDISVSAYTRIEKNVISPTIDDLLRYSQKLDIPIQDFLPETISINNKSDNQSGAVTFGTSNNYYYYGTDKIIENKDQENEKLRKEIEALKSQLENLKE